MYFNITRPFTEGQKGDTICRPGDWLDVARFFLFNFVVHALTVVNTPGAKTLRSAHTSFTAILLPFSGAYRAFQSMAFYRWAKEDDLHIALRAQALCTTIPSEHHPTGHVLFPALNVIEVHGQHSVPAHGFLEWTGLKGPTLRPTYQLTRVPWWFAITPLKQPYVKPEGSRSTPRMEHNPMSETKISCDYNVMKIFAAILQILSGVFQIYQARGSQLEKYGYAAYSLTVVPYVLMSLVNLLACVCIPQYPMMYIVHYGGKKRLIPKHLAETQEDPGAEVADPGAELKGTGVEVEDTGAEVLRLARSRSTSEHSANEQQALLRDDVSSTSDDSNSSAPPEEVVAADDEHHFDWEPEVKEMVSGVVGVAYGEWEFDKRDRTLPQSETSVSNKHHIAEHNSYLSMYRPSSAYQYILLRLSY